MEPRGQHWEKVCAVHSADKGLVSRMRNKCLQIYRKKELLQIKLKEGFEPAEEQDGDALSIQLSAN